MKKTALTQLLAYIRTYHSREPELGARMATDYNYPDKPGTFKQLKMFEKMKAG